MNLPSASGSALVFDASVQSGQSSQGSMDIQSLGTTPGVSVELGQASAAENLSWMVQVFVPKDSATSGTGFAFAVPEDLQKDVAAYGLQAARADGTSLPTWLQWDATAMRFVASAVPDGAFPMQIRATIGPKQAIVVIAERQTN